MADTFDPYREALVIETNTVWPTELPALSVAEQRRIEVALHAKPDAAAHLEYVRVHTGFCRTIVVTPADLERVSAAVS